MNNNKINLNNYKKIPETLTPKLYFLEFLDNLFGNSGDELIDSLDVYKNIINVSDALDSSTIKKLFEKISGEGCDKVKLEAISNYYLHETYKQTVRSNKSGCQLVVAIKDIACEPPACTVILIEAETANNTEQIVTDEINQAIKIVKKYIENIVLKNERDYIIAFERHCEYKNIICAIKLLDDERLEISGSSLQVSAAVAYLSALFNIRPHEEWQNSIFTGALSILNNGEDDQDYRIAAVGDIYYKARAADELYWCDKFYYPEECNKNLVLKQMDELSIKFNLKSLNTLRDLFNLLKIDDNFIKKHIIADEESVKNFLKSFTEIYCKNAGTTNNDPDKIIDSIISFYNKDWRSHEDGFSYNDLKLFYKKELSPFFSEIKSEINDIKLIRDQTNIKNEFICHYKLIIVKTLNFERRNYEYEMEDRIALLDGQYKIMNSQRFRFATY